MHATIFDLTIRAEGNAYSLHVAAPDSVGDLAAQPFALPFRLAELPQQRKNAAEWVKQARVALRVGSVEQRLAREFGTALFAHLFVGETLAGYRAARARLGPDERLLLRLRLPPELTPLPWELVYDSHTGVEQFLALDPRVTLVRHPELARPLTPLRVDGPLEVVVVLASPQSKIYAPLNLSRELARIRSALRDLERDGRLRLTTISGPGTLRQLRARLRQPVHVLHIVSHGDLDHTLGEGVLLFEDADGREEQVNAELLRQYIQFQRGQTRLVLLNACLGALSPDNDPFGSMGAALLRADVPAVIAMQFELPDSAAADLAEVFYDEIAAGQPVDLALSRARLHLYGRFQHSLDWAIPVLYLRASDGLLFAPQPSAEASSSPDRVATPANEMSAPSGRNVRIGGAPPPLDPPALARLWPQALSAFVTRRWDEAVRLLAEVAAHDPSYRDVQARLQRAREQLALQAFYADIAALRANDDWQAVLGALDELAQRALGFADKDGHRPWAERQQRREDRYAAALSACDASDWPSALTALDDLLRELPDDAEAKALAQFVREELDAHQQREEAEQRRRAHEEAERTQRERFRQIDADLSTGQFEAALDALDALLRSQPADHDAAKRVAVCIEQPAVPLAQRLRAGELAGTIGDPRPGVVTLPPALVRFAGGSFVIGEPPEVVKTLHGWYQNSVNTSTITLATFELARYPVTNAQYALFMADGGYTLDAPWWDEAGRVWLRRDDAKTKGLESYQIRTRKDQPEYWDNARFGKAHPNYPIVGVNWYEATAFCRWLSQHTGHNPEGHSYRLPSEAEWEFATRGTTRRTYAWGNQAPDAERANFDQAHQGTTPVGCFPAGATPEGVRDLTGNVWEWTRSEYKPYPYTPDDGREGGTDPANKRFTLRGASWNDPSVNLRASYRLNYLPDDRDNYLGFRLARHLPS